MAEGLRISLFVNAYSDRWGATGNPIYRPTTMKYSGHGNSGTSMINNSRARTGKLASWCQEQRKMGRKAEVRATITHGSCFFCDNPWGANISGGRQNRQADFGAAAAPSV